MYYEEEEDRVRTMLCGIPLSAEKLRMSDKKLGSEWWGTSYFFMTHLIAKHFTKNEKIDFNSLHLTAKNYGIDLWTNRDHLKRKLNDFVKAFHKTGLGNVHVTKDYALKIDGIIGRQEFRNFAVKEYEFSMGKGLVRYYPNIGIWGLRNMSNFAERILWHYIMRLFDCPRIYDSPTQDNELVALYTDLVETMQKKDLEFHGEHPWDDISPHALHLLRGWERHLISKEILKWFELGDVTFIAPSFFGTIDWRRILSGGKFSAEKQELVMEMLSNLRKTPSFPILKGETERYKLAKRLQRAGAIKLVEESKTPESEPYVYLVARDVFEDLDFRLKYSYSPKPFKEFGDSSLTDLVFRALGRARLYGDQVLPGLKYFKMDYKSKLGKIFDDLEQRQSVTVPEEIDIKIFDPLITIGALSQKGAVLDVHPQYSPITKNLADYWNELINDPSLASIRFPPKETVEKKERAQTEGQIKRKLSRYF